MSLESLRDLRLSGSKPAAVLKLVAGCKSPFADWPDVISITEDPRRMDWRPVIGLPMVLLVADGADDLAEQAFDAALAAGAQFCGAAWSDVRVSTVEESRPILRRMWESLCL